MDQSKTRTVPPAEPLPLPLPDNLAPAFERLFAQSDEVKMKLQLFEQKQVQFEAMMSSMLKELHDMRSELIDKLRP